MVRNLKRKWEEVETPITSCFRQSKSDRKCRDPGNGKEYGISRSALHVRKAKAEDVEPMYTLHVYTELFQQTSFHVRRRIESEWLSKTENTTMASLRKSQKFYPMSMRRRELLFCRRRLGVSFYETPPSPVHQNT